MAYLPNYDDEDPGARPMPVSPGMAAAANPMFAPPAAAAPAPTSPAAAGPSGFINFSQYLNANKDAATRTAGQVTGGLQKQGVAAQKGLQTAVAGFNQGVQAGSLQAPRQGIAIADTAAGARWMNTPAKPYVSTYSDADRTAAGKAAAEKWDGDLAAAGARGRVGKTAGRMNSDRAVADALAAYDAAHPKTDPHPGPATGTPGGPYAISRDQAAQYAGTQYTGPESLTEGASGEKLRTDTAKAAEGIANTARYGGLEAALRDEYGKGGYTEGQGQLDAGLVGQVGRRDLAGLRDRFRGLQGNLDAAGARAATDAAGAKGDTASIASGYEGILGQYDAKVAEEKAARDAANAAAAKGGKRTYDNLSDYKASDHVGNLNDAPGHMASAAATGSVAGGWGAAGSGFSAGVNDLLQAGARAAFGRETARGLKNGMKYADPTRYGNLEDDGGNMVSEWDSLGSEDVQGKVYGSMTQAELDEVAAMSPDQQKAWLAQRKQELGL